VKQSRQPDPRRAKIHYSYSVAEIARLYGYSRNAVYAWVQAGLPSFRFGRQVYVLGEELREFLTKRRKARKVRTPPGMIYCLGCRAPRAPAEGMIEFLHANGRTVNVRAICCGCGALMHRRVSLARLAEAGFRPQSTEADSHLADSATPSVNCDPPKDG
jgi:hypothetical protein